MLSHGKLKQRTRIVCVPLPGIPSENHMVAVHLTHLWFVDSDF